MKRRFLAVAAAAAAAAALTLAPSEARANGRFPESSQLYFAVNEPDTIILRVTFGLVISKDHGKTWRWVCEASIGYTGQEDPMYVPTPSGRIVASTFGGVSVTRDQACNWDFVGAPLGKQVFVDLAGNPNDRKQILAVASSYDSQDDAGTLFFKTGVYETKDEAQTFTQLAATFDHGLLVHTIDYAASDPNRIYMTAARDPGVNPKPVLMVSTDHGATFQERPFQLEGTERAVYIAAVDPKNADRVYLRTASAVDKPTRLLVTDDAGMTFRVILNADNGLRGFALSPDGTKVFVGGPRARVDRPAPDPPEVKRVGLYVASTTDLVFTKVTERDVQCLRYTDEGLWMCSNESDDGFGLGLSKDEGKTFEDKLHFCDIQGALTCPQDSQVTECKTSHEDRPVSCAQCWPLMRAQLGCDPGFKDAGPPDNFDGGLGDQPIGGGGGNCLCSTGPTSSWAAMTGIGGAIFAGLVLGTRRRRRRR